MRTDWTPLAIVKDWWFNIASSLEFWSWQREPVVPGLLTTLLTISAALAFVAGGLWLVRSRRRSESDPRGATWGVWSTVLAAGFATLALSFPAYLVLNTARSLWRTQFLSRIGSGLVWTAVLGLVSIAFTKTALRSAAVLLLASIVVYFGAGSAIAKSAVHRKIWERHRAVIVKILRVIPSVRPGTVIVLTGVPKDDDPFGHNMWFDFAIRLSYPYIPVTGVYYYSDGTPSPGNNMEASEDRWTMLTTGMPTVVRDTSLANTIVVEWRGSGSAQIAKSFPGFICHTTCAAELYNPGSQITGPISPVAVNRYHLDRSDIAVLQRASRTISRFLYPPLA